MAYKQEEITGLLFKLKSPKICDIIVEEQQKRIPFGSVSDIDIKTHRTEVVFWDGPRLITNKALVKTLINPETLRELSLSATLQVAVNNALSQ